MNIEDIRLYCLSKPGVSEDCAFGPQTILFRLCGKIFACVDLNRPNLVVCKSDEDAAEKLRMHYRGINGAWHWNKRYWNEVDLDADVPDRLILELLDTSYQLVRSHLPKKTLFNFQDLPEGWYHEHYSVLDSAMNRIRCKLPAIESFPYWMVTADFQTAGRGQGKNTWEAEDKKNLLLAFRFYPTAVKAVDQFLLLQCISLAVVSTIEKYNRKDVKIKWPNDIYCGDKKICGILIEHDLCGAYLTETRCGIGINVNQRQFLSPAPNPVSIFQFFGKEVDRATVLRNFIQAFLKEYNLLLNSGNESITKRYLAKLYRSSGWYPYRDVAGEFEARLLGVEEDGRLILLDRAGRTRTYAHKEVEFILQKN